MKRPLARPVMQVLEAGRREPVGGLARRAVLLMGQLGVAVQVLIEVLLPTADLSGTGEDCGDGIVHRSSMAITGLKTATFRGLMPAMGPGFSFELLLLSW